jgi:D-3-phosphoglycerate dehydrogenase
MRLLLTHVPLARRQYYGARALARLQELVEVVLHEGDAPLDPKGLIAAAGGVDLIIADRATAVPGEVFAGLPGLRVVMRSAIDIRNIDVAAASQAGVLVTHAEAGFVQSVVELAVGLLVDLSRGVTRAAADYHAGRMPEIRSAASLAAARWANRLWPHLARWRRCSPRSASRCCVRSPCPGRRPALRQAAAGGSSGPR